MNQRIQKITFDDANIFLLVNGKKHRVPMSALSMRLMRATKEQREAFRFSPAGFVVYWTKLDLELPVNGLLQMCQKVF